MKLGTWIQTVMKHRGIKSNRAVSRQCGLSATTISAIIRDDIPVGLDAVEKLARWGKLSTGDLVDLINPPDERIEQSTASLARQFASFLQQYPDLQRLFEKMLLAYERGEFSPIAFKHALQGGIIAVMEQERESEAEFEVERERVLA